MTDSRLHGGPGRAVRRTAVGWVALLVVLLAGCAAPTEQAGPAATPTGSPEWPPAAGAPAPTPPERPATASPSPPAQPSTEPSPAPSAEPPEPRVPSLRLGDHGPRVRALQDRLSSLGFWLDGPDGVFGPTTLHAVVAFQKYAGLDRDGVAGPRTWAALESARRPAPRSTQGRVIEVDLTRQLLLIARDGEVSWVLDTSTGAVPGTTPAGRYQVFREVDGPDNGPLGTLYRPKYFVGGVAVHGFPSVPPYPASHGCVRVIDPAMDWLWSSGSMPIGQPVWVY